MIEELLQHEYSNIDNNTNGYWRQIVSSIEKVINSGDSRKLRLASDEIRRLSVDGKFDVKQLNTAMKLVLVEATVSKDKSKETKKHDDARQKITRNKKIRKDDFRKILKS